MVGMSTLQQRVTQVLSDGASGYATEDSEIDIVDSLSRMLQKAEADLDAVQAHVDNLKWKLAKAQQQRQD
jgi:hypothetical protein